MALVLSGCSTSTFSAGSVEDLESAQVQAGSSDAGSFVGAPSGPADQTDDNEPDQATTVPTTEAPATETSVDEEAAPDTGPVGVPEGVPSENPGLSTDPNIIYLANTCYNSPDATGAVEVACSEPHNIEIYAIRDLPGAPGAPFQGLDAALGLCNEDFQRITGVGLGIATIYTRSVLRPSEETWAEGERDVTCYVRYPETTTLRMSEVNPVRDFGLVSVYGMEVGDCLIGFDESETTFTPVPCEEPHDVEVFVDVDLPDGAFPGVDAVDAEAEQLCFGAPFTEYVGRSYNTSAIFALQSRPTEETWNLGDRAINCLLTEEDGGVRSGSLKDSGL